MATRLGEANIKSRVMVLKGIDGELELPFDALQLERFLGAFLTRGDSTAFNVPAAEDYQLRTRFITLNLDRFAGESNESIAARHGATTVFLNGESEFVEEKGGNAVKALADALQADLGLLRTAVITGADGDLLEDGILAFDARYARHVKARFREQGTALATSVGARARERILDLERTKNRDALWPFWFQVPAEQVAPHYIVGLLRALWRETVGPHLKRERERRERTVRVPSDLASTMADAHGQRCTTVVEREPSFRVLVQPPRGVALMLPLYDSIRTARGGISLARVLKPAAFKFWLGSLVLYEDQGMREDGQFDCDDVDPILDVIGITKPSGRRVHQTINRREGRAHAKLLSESRVVQVGDLCQEGGDALLSRLHLEKGDRTIGYAHSRLVVGALRGVRNANGEYEKPAYLQVPRELVRIDTRHIFVAMGLASVIRSKAFAMLRAQSDTIEVPLVEVLDSAGERWREEAPKRGVVNYFNTQIADICEIASEGGLGTVRSDGAGQDTVLTITVSEKMRNGYRQPRDGGRGLIEGAREHERIERTARRQRGRHAG